MARARKKKGLDKRRRSALERLLKVESPNIDQRHDIAMLEARLNGYAK